MEQQDISITNVYTRRCECLNVKLRWSTTKEESIKQHLQRHCVHMVELEVVRNEN